MKMSRKEAEEIATKLSVFGFGKLQSLITLNNMLEREGISLEAVKAYIKWTQDTRDAYEEKMKKVVEKNTEMWNKNTRKCPLCKKPLLLRAVRIPRGKGNVKGYTCHWFCSSEECLFEEYSKEDFKELYKKIMSRR